MISKLKLSELLGVKYTALTSSIERGVFPAPTFGIKRKYYTQADINAMKESQFLIAKYPVLKTLKLEENV